MCSKLKYFVLALILDAAASSPYNIPRTNVISSNENDIQRRNEPAPRSIPTYMSPVPTAVDSELNQEILRQSNNLRDPRSLNSNNNDEKEYSRINEHLPSVVHSTKSYANPSSTLDGNEVLGHLLRQNKPIVNDIVEPIANGQVIRNIINSEGYNRLPLNENDKPETLSHVGFNNYEPLKIQSAPEQKVAFQSPVFPNVADLHTYRPATPVRDFNVDREWSNIARAQPKLPEFIAERLRHPVNIQRGQIIGQQVHRPLQADLTGIGQQHDIQKIISDQRIQNVLSSVKQTKRYLVIHPNGTVEHVDSIGPIAARHPNYVLVNAGHVVPAKTMENIDESNVQVPVPTLDPTSHTKIPVLSGSQLPEPIIRNKEAADDLQTSLFETSTIVEEEPSFSSTVPADITPSTTRIAEANENQEQKISEKSLGIEELSDIEDGSITKTGSDNSEGIEETDENTTEVDESSSAAAVIIPIDTITENNAPDVAPTLLNEVENVIEDVLPTIQSTKTVENEDSESDVYESELVEGRRASKPMVYYTSDPDFWTKVSDGKDSNFIYFFQVKSSPRVEKDRQRTIYPDGTILEELTETVWDEEGGAPKVTKSSKIIHPEDL